MRRLVTLAIVLGVVSLACGRDPVRPLAAFPREPVPDRVGDLDVAEEAGARTAFKSAGAASMVARGKVFTFRREGEVMAALQVSQLEPKYDTSEIEVRRGVRSYIERGRYRWFKVEGQWIGVQELREVKLYLWFPRDDLFEVLQVRPDVAGANDLVRAIVTHQQDALS